MCQLHTTIDNADAFAEKLLGTLNNAAIALGLSIGHRAGLFDALADADGPLTSTELAEDANCHERYVREWLGAMVMGEIVVWDPETCRYALPSAHAAFLTRAVGGDNLAIFTQYISVLGRVEDDVLSCFHNGGGVPYERFPRFHAVMAEDSGLSTLPLLIDSVLPLIDGLRDRLEAGIDVLDVGCGSGRALALLATHFPRSRFVGYDLSPIAFERARANASALPNLRFELVDVTEMADIAAFDLVTAFDAIHDQARPRRVLANIRRALRDDGVFLMQDIRASSNLEDNHDLPLAPLLYTLSYMHCMTVSLAQGGEGLGAMWGMQKAVELLAEAGFDSVERHSPEHDFQNDYWVCKSQ